MADLPYTLPAFALGDTAPADWANQVKANFDQIAAQLPFAFSAGTTSITLSSAASGSTSVTFPAGRFTQIPIVTFGRGANGNKFVVNNSGLTTSGMTVTVASGDGSSYTGTVFVYWMAVQMASASAAG